MCFDKYLTVGLLIGLNIISLCFSLGLLGPAHIVIERIEQCNDPEKYPVENNLVVRKINRTSAGFNGCIQLPDDIGPTSSVQVYGEKWGDGGWKPNALNLDQENLCELMKKHLNEAFINVLKFNGVTNYECPLKKRDICIENFVTDLGSTFPSALYGKFRAEVIILIDSKPMFCIRPVITSTPHAPGWPK